MKKILFLTMILMGLSGDKVLALVTESTAISVLKPFMHGESVDSRLYAFHSPIYPQAGSSPVYTAVANVNGNSPTTPSTLGIKRIRVWVRVYQITLSASGTRELHQKFESTKLCSYAAPYPQTGMCSHKAPELPDLPENSYVWYQASMRLSDDTLVRDRKIIHTAKLSDAVKDSFHDAYPVYSRGIKNEKFNLLFVADTDYPNEGAYLSDVQDFVYNGLFAGDGVRKVRRFFNVYLNDFSQKINVDQNSCSSNDALSAQEPANWEDLSGIDVRFYAHATDFIDCSQLGLGGGSISLTDAAKTTMHEMLHALIGKGDEYPSSSGYVLGSHPNLFVKKEDCEDHAKTFHSTKYEASPKCRSLGVPIGGNESPYFHWCPEDDIMDTGLGKLEAEEWYSFYDQIDEHNLSAFSVLAQASKTAITPKETADTRSTTASRDLNISEDAEEVALNSEASIKAALEEERSEKGQKTLSLRLRFRGPEVILERYKVINGVAAPRIFYPKLKSDFLVSLFDNQGNLIQEFWTPDPRHIQDIDFVIQEISHNLRIAWQDNIARIRIQDKEGKVLLEAPVSEAAPSKTEPTKTAPDQSPTPSR